MLITIKRHIQTKIPRYRFTKNKKREKKKKVKDFTWEQMRLPEMADWAIGAEDKGRNVAAMKGSCGSKEESGEQRFAEEPRGQRWFMMATSGWNGGFSGTARQQKTESGKSWRTALERHIVTGKGGRVASRQWSNGSFGRAA